uniref:FCH and mu domain containing endocytic adaptor 2 n=1 Tax=Oncorhynchus kisutch TaxID=8019 RepID=A0A8C7IXL8_ONCKI
MITPYFLQNFWGEKNNGFDVLYHNMKHGQISSKELTEFIRERATIEEVYARSMTKLAKSAGNFSQLGTFAPVWDVIKTSTEKLASCHLELVRKLQELIKDVQKYVDDQAKAHKKTKEEVASTLESVQTIQTTGVALQKSKENYNAKTVEQERLRKEGATQRDVDKAGVKAKKATETYKGFVEKYATAKSEFEQKMAETAQKFQDIEESHIVHMKDIIQSYTQSVDETHVQIGEVRIEFERNMENTSVEGLIQKLSDSKGTGKERPDALEARHSKCKSSEVLLSLKNVTLPSPLKEPNPERGKHLRSAGKTTRTQTRRSRQKLNLLMSPRLMKMASASDRKDRNQMISFLNTPHFNTVKPSNTVFKLFLSFLHLLGL